LIERRKGRAKARQKTRKHPELTCQSNERSSQHKNTTIVQKEYSKTNTKSKRRIRRRTEIRPVKLLINMTENEFQCKTAS